VAAPHVLRSYGPGLRLVEVVVPRTGLFSWLSPWRFVPRISVHYLKDRFAFGRFALDIMYCKIHQII
jgi:hypothetical protein